MTRNGLLGSSGQRTPARTKIFLLLAALLFTYSLVGGRSVGFLELKAPAGLFSGKRLSLKREKAMVPGRVRNLILIF